jgi:hypothetical protein
LKGELEASPPPLQILEQSVATVLTSPHETIALIPVASHRREQFLGDIAGLGEMLGNNFSCHQGFVLAEGPGQAVEYLTFETLDVDLD